ncbi:class I SAM-dependent methyltransferase [Neptuniibacter sp. QD37_6]|uniref:class I SAM-dependent methyltransferase n=1 Tax=Neptuniibacter sp. QD37_6 TaxID=3398210 RepID=UPI0039F4AE6C
MKTNVDKLKILDLNRRFHDEVEADNYDERMGVNHSTLEVKDTVLELESVLGRPLPAKGRVVDLGAGTGNISIKLALDGRFEKVTAVDISSKSLQVLESTALKHGVEVETIVSDMQKLLFETNSLDLVVGCAFLHHLPDPVAFMLEVRRVLKPEAPFIIIGEPSYFGAAVTNMVKFPLVLINRLRNSFSRERFFHWEHDQIDVHTFSHDDIAEIFNNNFKEIRVCSEGFAEPVIDQAALVPLRHVLPDYLPLRVKFSVIRKVARFTDYLIFNPLLPASMKVTLKISGSS